MNQGLKLKLENLPDTPGVYLFKNKAGQIIYIGKAKNLRHRVRSYFNSPHSHDRKTSRLIAAASDFDLIVTDSEIEALILEANLVKEHHPRYNINLKDDKHFPYIKVTTREPFPRLLVVRRLEKDGSRYFGPYTNSKSMRRTITFLSRLFKIRTCHLTIPHPSGKVQKVCLDFHIGRCGGPCENLQSQEDYSRNIDSVIMFLMGRSEALIKELSARMEKSSKRMQFEQAAQIRDQIEALTNMRQKQKVDAGQAVNRDIIAFAREGSLTIVVIFQIRDGILIGRQDFQLISEVDEIDVEVISAFIRQYYTDQPNLPEELYFPVAVPDEELIGQWLSTAAGQKVKIHTPQKGEKLRLVDMAAQNARLLLDEILIQRKQFKERTSKAVQALKENLGLADSPLTIACVDISNLGESDAVGSLVFFDNGKPKKSEYRHFRIKGVKGQDDFAMMREIIGRYFFRLNEEKRTGPDLLVVDGGKGQLSSVIRELQSLGFENQTVIGLAKKFEEIYFPNRSEPLTLPKSSPGLGLLKRIRDEAHRFAIEYNRKVRSQRTLKSSLDYLKGIGPKRRQLLLTHFGSLDRIRLASLEELSAVKGMPQNIAKLVFDTLHVTKKSDNLAG